MAMVEDCNCDALKNHRSCQIDLIEASNGPGGVLSEETPFTHAWGLLRFPALKWQWWQVLFCIPLV